MPPSRTHYSAIHGHLDYPDNLRPLLGDYHDNLLPEYRKSEQDLERGVGGMIDSFR
jgi:hypothetical protein